MEAWLSRRAFGPATRWSRRRRGSSCGAAFRAPACGRSHRRPGSCSPPGRRGRDPPARTAPQRRLGAAVGEQFAAYVKQQRRWLTLLIEFWAQAAGDPKLGPKFAERHGKLRSAIAEVLAERAARLGLALALPADELATVLIALTNGMAVEQLADPHGVPKDLYGQALDLLLG